MTNTVHTKRVLALTAALAAAVAMTLAVGTASAAPLKNAERVCVKAGGTLTGDLQIRYICEGNDPTKAFSFMTHAQGQCLHSFKGAFSVQAEDDITGDFRYTCAFE